MAVSKSVIVLLALVAVAAAAENSRVKKQVLLAGAYPYAAAVGAAVVPPAPRVGEDDGSWAPNKYDAVVVPVAAPIAPIAPVIPHAYAAPIPYAYAPYAPFAPYAYAYGDDGSYWQGKYGPENIQSLE
uniref:Uncharacterized protein n=1 Tax=Graphocephala atropunctata TaxID=36148 RepID=A0A1B6LSN7_9HEMI